MAKGGSRILTKLAVRMVLAVVIAGAVSAWAVLQLDNSYRARALLILAPMPFEQKDEVPGIVGSDLELNQRINFLQVEMLEALAMPDYRLLLTSEEMAAQLRDKLVELYTARGIDPGRLTIEKVQRALEVRSKVHHETLEKVEYQQVVEMLLDAKHPGVAAETANYWVELSIDLAERMRTIGREGAVQYVEDQLDEVWSQLEFANEQLARLEEEWNPDAMAERLAALEAASTEYGLRRVESAARAAGLQARIELLGAELEEPPNDLIARTGLMQQRTEAAAELAELRAERDALETEVGELAPRIAQLRADLARVRRQQKELELNVGTYEEIIDELQVTLKATQMAAADVIPQFKIAAPAVAPEEKSGPHRTLIVLVTVFLAAVAVPVHLFGMVALRRYARSVEAETAPGGADAAG